jgi:hypothetical protein
MCVAIQRRAPGLVQGKVYRWIGRHGLQQTNASRAFHYADTAAQVIVVVVAVIVIDLVSARIRTRLI